MYYELTVATSSNSNYCAIVKAPYKDRSGFFMCTKIAKFIGFSENKLVYQRCDPIEVMINGTFILEEYKGDILD